MNPWFWLIPGFMVFCFGSFCTFSKSIRESNYYFLAFFLISLVGSFVWVRASYQIGTQDNALVKILFFSLVWDLLMAVAYYLIPIALKGQELNWQAYAAITLTIIGMIWFKFATS